MMKVRKKNVDGGNQFLIEICFPLPKMEEYHKKVGFPQAKHVILL